MLLLKSFGGPWGSADGAPEGSHPLSLSLRARVWHPSTRIDVRLLGPCFKTGRILPLSQHPRRSAVLGLGGPHPAPGCNTPKGWIPGALTRPPKPMLARPPGSTPSRRATEPRRASSDRMRFPCNDFTYYFTLFSKCFSPFDYSTCALSVSGRYLALDGIYHPLRAAFPNNSTLRRSFTRRGPSPDTGLSPSMASRPRGLGAGALPKRPLQITTRTPR